jgi:predicted DNA-binding protein with PD1-like motif
MRHKILNDAGERTEALIFDTGDEVMSLLQRFCEEHEVTAARFTAIGAFRSAVLGYFNWERKEYDRIPVDEQVEVLSLTGDVALSDGKPKIHAHAVLGRHDGSTRGGHLLEAQVRPTLEVILIESPAWLKRTMDPESRIPLIDIDA